MNPFLTIFRSYLRWRHSKGYGVHSPFAYNLVKLALRPGTAYAYYGYYDIDKALVAEGKKGYPRLRKDARLALRIMATLRSRRLLSCPQRSDTFKAVAGALRIPCPPCKEKRIPPPEPGDFLLLRNDIHPVAEVASRLGSGTTVMVIDPSPALRDALLAFVGNGLTFVGKRIIIVIPNPDMAFVSYEMKL